MTTITLTVKMKITDDHGNQPTMKQVLAMVDASENAVRNRLFGEGFSPDDVAIEQWDINTEASDAEDSMWGNA